MSITNKLGIVATVILILVMLGLFIRTFKSVIIRRIMSVFLIAVSVACVGYGVYQLYIYYVPNWNTVVEKTMKSVVTIQTPYGTGSGFIIAPDGILMTNTHVVGDSQDINVLLYSGEEIKATLVKKGTPPLDIAVLKIDGSGYAALSPADALGCKEGDEVLAIGSPQGLTNSVTKGIISSCQRNIGFIRYIQVDAAINPGNSGGPVINKKGQVIGIATMKLIGPGLEGLNFALSIEEALDFKENRTSAAHIMSNFLAEQKYEEDMLNKMIAATRGELTSCVNKIYAQVKNGKISVDDAKKMDDQLSRPPQGFNTLNDWVVYLTKRVVGKEISEREAVVIIQQHCPVS